MNQRIKYLREKSLNAVESLTAERALLITSFYKSEDAKRLSPPVLRARAFEYILANNIGWCLGNVIKLITRDKENNVQDLLKAKHYIELELEMVHGCDKNGNKLGKYTKEISI